VTGRVLLIAVCVVVTAWLAVLLRDAVVAAPGTDRAAGRVPPVRAELAPAIDGLRRARLLNPDSQLDVYRARLELAARDPAGSLRTAEQIVRREPDNVDAWLSVWAGAVGVKDRRRASQALDQVARLNRLLKLPR